MSTTRPGTIDAKIKRLTRISQGDIFRDIEYIERVTERRGIIEVSRIVFPLVVVLTQDCDLEQDSRYYSKVKPQTDDKRLLSVLVAPLYNAEHVFQGTHLSDLHLTMTAINSSRTPGKSIRQNETPRYHYMDFQDRLGLVAQIADFKHYFSVNVSYLIKLRPKHFVCRISELFREDLSIRFASYLSRIGLPEMTKIAEQPKAIT